LKLCRFCLIWQRAGVTLLVYLAASVGERWRQTAEDVSMGDAWALIEPWLKVVGAVAVIFALLLTWRTHAERTTFEMIDRLYSLCHTLEAHALRDWHLSHLLCIGGEEYEQVKGRIKLLAHTDPSKLPEYLVKERFFAIHVFVIYEQVYYQWKHSSRIFHRRRRIFLGEMLSYFTDRLIINPRLLHFVHTDTTGASIHLELCSKAFLDTAIGRLKPVGGKLKVDHDGPFAAATQQEKPA
jgi:hypothetical protein